MDKCAICMEPAPQLFETGKEGEYACFKCQPLVPEITIGAARTEESEEAEGGQDLFCGICQKTFQKNAQLQAHLRNHRAERRFVCTYCNKAFSQSNNLRAHLRIHTNERPYKCNECGKAFTQVTNLNNHVRLHTGERPFVCPEPGCDKAYAQVTNLNQHRKRHLNGRLVESTYDCNICGEQFQQRNHMFTHRRAAHGDASKSPVRSAAARRLVCKPCDLTFSSEKLLKEHRAQHTDHQSNSGELRCVFQSCGAVLADARAHTEHLLQRHQLRVLAASHTRPPRRGRPPKVHKEVRDEDGESDPLALEEKDYEVPVVYPIKILNSDQFRVVNKIKLQSMFQ